MPRRDRGTFRENARRITIEKFNADDIARAFEDDVRRDPKLVTDGLIETKAIRARGVEPFEVFEGEGNALVYGGASAFFDLLIGAGNQTAFNNANAYLGSGTSNTATTSGMTDLQGTNSREGMEATYPIHTDGVTAANDSCDFKAQWGTSSGNYTWEEWGIFNASTAGRMLNRKTESMGTKTSVAVWALTVTVDLT